MLNKYLLNEERVNELSYLSLVIFSCSGKGSEKVEGRTSVFPGKDDRQRTARSGGY